jgi:two-component sensor histidine kinase
VQRTFGRDVQVDVQDDTTLQFVLPEAESIPIALTLNELLTNALKHSAQGAVQCRLGNDGEAVHLRIVNSGALPEGFDLAGFRGGVSGLGLVRALLPRRRATLALTQQGDEVHAEVRLSAPSVQRLPL